MQPSPTDTTLATRLEQLASELRAHPPTGTDGEPAELVGLLPCEPVVGDAAVACWVAPDGGEQFDLVRLDDGRRIVEHTALREALTLLAMTETLEELASFDTVPELEHALRSWATSESTHVDDRLAASIDRAAMALHELGSRAPGDAPRVARTSWLDAIGAALRGLETAWGGLEAEAERWSDAHLAGDPDSAIAIARVQALWTTISGARRGPLARPSSAALHEGREAGAAMAAAIAEATAPAG